MREESLETTVHLTRFNRIIFLTVVIDTLFLPYLPGIGLSLSMILIPIWILMNFKHLNFSNIALVTIFFVFWAGLSYIISLYQLPAFAIGNFVSLATLIYGLILYWFLSESHKLFNYDLTNFFIAYLIFIFLFSVVYYFSPELYFDLRSIWSLSDTVEVTDTLLISRYTGIVSEPNDMATLSNALAIYLLFNKRVSKNWALLIVGMVGFITINTLSNTGIILFGITLVLFIVYTAADFRLKSRVNIFSLIFGIVIILPLLIFLIYQLLNSEVFEAFQYRWSINSADSRFNRWETVLENRTILENIFFGDGGTMIVNGLAFRPHNGHFHLIFNYGLIAYLLFMWLVFRPKLKKVLSEYFFMIPLLVGFTVNVAITDFRFYLQMILLVSSYHFVDEKAASRQQIQESRTAELEEKKVEKLKYLPQR